MTRDVRGAFGNMHQVIEYRGGSFANAFGEEIPIRKDRKEGEGTDNFAESEKKGYGGEGLLLCRGIPSFGSLGGLRQISNEQLFLGALKRVKLNLPPSLGGAKNSDGFCYGTASRRRKFISPTPKMREAMRES